MPNRLANEVSPYLIQHAENPVDWYAWGDEAFLESRAWDKPIFLSVGYSTCHWCHVMEHESFEDPDVAAVLNEHFVSIKVDREERPDVDRVYMAFVQATTGAGGWPMSVWLTPDLKPFYGGTYFPPTSRYGRPGFVEVLNRVAQLWTDDRERLTQSADEVLARLRHTQTDDHVSSDGRRIAPVDALAAGVVQFEQAFDATHGGFGRAPKFPRPAELLLLLREYRRTGRGQLLEMVVRTLQAMADGGMRDHVGGGFHRYSVDAEWRIPHFEKMLYDQAQLTLAYLEAGQVLRDNRFVEVAQDTLTYVARELTNADGGFLSAEDADSVPASHADRAGARAVEGAFYLWSTAELDSVLGEDAKAVARRYGVKPGGNAPHDPTGELAGLNQLYVACSVRTVADELHTTPDDVAQRIARARPRLLAARGRRPRPHLDDKVLAAWNGLMIAGAARVAHVVETESSTALQLACRAAAFVRDTLWDASVRVLHRRYRDGRASIEGYCEDYAFMIWGLLELFQTSGDPVWLAWARDLQTRQDELFWDDVAGGWFSTTGEDASVLLRGKDDYDGAEPSAGSVSVLNLLTLVHLGSDESARRKIEMTLARFGARLGQAARVVPLMTAALSQFHTGTAQVVIVGPGGRADTEALKRVVAGTYLPFAVRVTVEPGQRQTALVRQLPFVEGLTLRGGQATAYVCSNFACREPVTDADRLAEQLASLGKLP